jgi:hypothetical protein
MRAYVDQEIEMSMDTASGAESIKLTASSELMENYATGSVIDGKSKHSVAVVQDANGSPMTLSISSDKALFIIMRSWQPNHPTGWQQFDLTTALGKELEVQAFGVGQEPGGDFTIAVALRGKKETDPTLFYVTKALSNDPKKTDWANFRDQWREREKKAAPVKRILVGNDQILQDGQKRGPLVIAMTEENNQAQYYRVNADVTTPGWWKPLELAFNAPDVLDIAIGKGFDGDGYYTLASQVGGKAMNFTSLPDSGGRVIHVRLPVPPGAAALAVLPEDDKGLTGLYVAGDGLYHIPASEQENGKKVTTIAAAKDAPGLKGLFVREDSDRVAIWALDKGNRMQYVSGKKESQAGDSTRFGIPKKWELPIVLRRDVAEIAPIRNGQKKTNDLVVIERNKTLAHLTQDPTNSIWNQRDIPLQDTGKLQTFNCYTTQINLRKQDDTPITNQAFKLTASEWCEVLINGVSHMIDSQNAVEVKTDVQGNITFLNKVSTISTPIFNLSGCPEPINPAFKIKEGLKKIKTADDLKKAERQNGKAVVDPSRVKEGDWEKAADGINNLNKVCDKLPPNGSTSRNYLSSVSAEELPPGCWGMSFGEGGAMQYYEGDAALAMMQEALSAIDNPAIQSDYDNWWNSILKAAGDVIEWIRNAVERAAQFIIEEIEEAGKRVWQFVVKIGNEAFRFVIECLGHAYNIFNWLLEKTLGLNLNDIKEWLGFIFAWEDILVTHKVMKNVARETLKYGESQIEYLKKEVDRFFDELIKMAENIKPVGGERGGANLRAESRIENVNSKLPENGRKSLEFMTKGPGGNFGSYQLLHGGVLKANVSPGVASSSNELGQFFKKVLEPFLTGITETVTGLSNELKEIFEKGNLTPDEIIRRLSSAAIVGIFKTLKGVVIGILNAFQELLKGIREILDYDLQIPFLSAFFEKITGCKKLTLLEGLMLLFAIPATVGYKVLTGKAPFSAGTGGLDTDDHVALFKKFQDPSVMLGDTAARSEVQIYSYLGGLLSAVITWIVSAVDAGLSGAGLKMPGWISIILGVIQLGCTIPIGKWTTGRTGGWVTRWSVLIRGIYDSAAPAELVLSGSFQIVAGLLKAFFDLIKFIQEIGGRWGLVVWGGVEDSLLLASDLFGGGAKISTVPNKRVGLAVLAFGASHARGGIAMGRAVYTIVTD